MFIPDLNKPTVRDIPYDKLFEQGVKSLFFDLDNTLIAYDVPVLDTQMVQFLNALQSRFTIVVISNSGKKRVQKALQNTGLVGIWHAKKPLKSGLRKALKASQSKPCEAMIIGDQLMTDVFGGHRLGLLTCLVSPIKIKSDRWMTKVNRKLEKMVIDRIKKRYPDLYQERFLTNG